jgi:hypothetical protein
MHYIKEDLSIHNPIWNALSQILKDDRLVYNPDNLIYDIGFTFNNINYKARIEYYDEACSSVDVYSEFDGVVNDETVYVRDIPTAVAEAS